MSVFGAFSLLIVAAALLSFLNARFLRLSTAVGVTLLVIASGLALIAAGAAGLPVRPFAVRVITLLDLPELVLNGMLAFLLFAGALKVAVDFKELIGHGWAIAVLATAGVVASTFVVGGLTWALNHVLGAGLGMTACLLFGALISPTDPIAVLAILRSASAPKSIEVLMAGEALFNDGIGVVTFSVILGLIGTSGHMDAGMGAILLAREVLGGLALGVAAGSLSFLMLRSIDDYPVEILLTLALATGLYGLATALHTSGPLAVVVAGLMVGGAGRTRAMSPRTVHELDRFWEMVDEILNVVLFVLVGFQLLVMPFTWTILLMGAGTSCFVLLARFLSVGATAVALKRIAPFPQHAVKLLTWGGMRGGLSLAMALSLGPRIAGRQTIQATTYLVAVLSIAVQGLTFGRLVRWTARHTPR